MATLVIMAAGMGSRYGGLKQIEPIGSNGEILLEYNVFDALKAGFNKVVFVLREDLVADFKTLFGDKIAKHMEVAYAIQRIDDLPEGFTVPEGRTKPWGTAHAVYCAREMVRDAFCVINADDFYGRDSFQKVFDFLKAGSEAMPYRCCMAGFRVENTLTEIGSVCRGVCETDENGMLTSITEMTQIEKDVGGIMDKDTGTPIAEGTHVSMNFWGFPCAVLEELGAHFAVFLKENKNPLKGEYYLPTYVDSLLKEGKATAKVLDTAAKWYGITYKQDKDALCAAVQSMREAGIYPPVLF